MKPDHRIGIEELPEGRLESQFTIPAGTTCGGSINPFGTVVTIGGSFADDSSRARADRARALIENARESVLIERIAQRAAELVGQRIQRIEDRFDFTDEEKTAEHLPNRLAIGEKLDEQIAISMQAYGCIPPKLYLTGEDFDLWRATAEGMGAPFYQGIEIVELEGPR